MKDNLDARMIDLLIRMGFVALFIWAALSMIAPLAGLMLWAVILTVAVYPVYSGLSRLLGGRETLSAVLVTLLGLAIALGPVALLVGSAIEVAVLAKKRLAAGESLFPAPPEQLMNLPIVGEPLHSLWTQATAQVGPMLTQHGSTFLAASGSILDRIAHYGLDFLIIVASVVLMGLMFRPGPALALESRKFANRVFAPRGGYMIDLAGATVRNVSRGIVGVAILQGILAGLVLMAFGIKAAGLIALAGIFLSIIQVGPGLILTPTIIWAWTAMPPGKAALLTVILVPLMVVDDMLKPVFMGRGLKTPMLVILVGVLGGIAAHGLIGLFVGPVILAVFYEMFLIWVDSDKPDAPEDPDSPEDIAPAIAATTPPASPTN
ncbi:MAG: AI-2E family transporter [Rhodobacteraceae bacterium]|nr:AI-2E family transporter [Paracoccaceae bacterium]